MHITIDVPKGEELDQLLTLAEQQLADFRRTISQLQSVARSIEAQVSLSPGTPDPPAGDDAEKAAQALVTYNQARFGKEAIP